MVGNLQQRKMPANHFRFFTSQEYFSTSFSSPFQPFINNCSRKVPVQKNELKLLKSLYLKLLIFYANLSWKNSLYVQSFASEYWISSYVWDRRSYDKDTGDNDIFTAVVSKGCIPFFSDNSVQKIDFFTTILICKFQVGKLALMV